MLIFNLLDVPKNFALGPSAELCLKVRSGSLAQRKVSFY